SVQANTLKELIALAKKEKLAYASSGIGTTTHLSMERIKTATGVDITHVPYQPAQAVTAAVAGQTQISSTSMPPAVPQIKAGKPQVGGSGEGLCGEGGLSTRMIDRVGRWVEAALADVSDGSTVLVGGFGGAGVPEELIDALIAQGAEDLTIVNNNAGNGEVGVAALLKAGRVRKIVCSYPRLADGYVFERLYRAGKVELELVPQGTLSERMRAAGAGIGAFYTPTGYGTDLAKGKETRVIEGKGHVLEYPIRGDVALVKAERGDRWGNLVYRKSARNFGPTMA